MTHAVAAEMTAESPLCHPPPSAVQGLVQAASVCLAVLHARFALFEILQRVNGGRPTEAVLAGCLLLGAAAGCAPIVACQYPHSQRGRRWLAILAAAGALLVLLRPPLPTQAGHPAHAALLLLCGMRGVHPDHESISLPMSCSALSVGSTDIWSSDVAVAYCLHRGPLQTYGA